MAIIKMKKFQIAGLKKDIDQISKYIIDSRKVELTDSILKVKTLNPLQKNNPDRDLLNRVRELMDNLNIDFRKIKIEPGISDKVNSKEINRRLQPLIRHIEKLQRIKKRIKQEEDRLENLKRHIWLMRRMDIDLEELRELSYISLIFGSVSKDNYQRLIEVINNEPILIVEVYQDDDRVWFFSFTKKENEEKTLNILKSAYFEHIELPSRVKGQPAKILKRADYRLERIKIIYEQIDLEYKKMAHRYNKHLIKYYQQLLMAEKIGEVCNQYYGQTEHVFLLTGWIPEQEEDLFKSELEREFPIIIYSSTSVEKADQEEIPPSLMNNPAWVKPFEGLVKLYGIPAYGEMDPSKFLAITYIIMFGMMFGDLGQGLVFALTGWLIYSGKLKLASRETSYLLMLLGLSSMVFGIFYGSIFGLEDIIPALVIRPMENIILWLGITIIFGIVLLIISMVFNLVNSYQSKDAGEGLFSRNGLSGFFFYLFVLANLASLALRGRLMFSLTITLILLILPIVLIFLREPLENLVEGKKEILPEKPGEYFLESFFELFDTLLGYMSNTISFVRIGAFTLNHVGLSMTVLILSDMMHNSLGSLLMLIIGNIIIMGLEGLVVGIQVLRLEFFELFGKFYKGDGKEFSPLEL